VSAQIRILLDGEPHPLPLDDLAWERLAPCGCTVGTMVAFTADQSVAHRAFVQNADARKRDATLGFQLRLAERHGVIDRMKGRCPHVPVWGVDRAPIPPGHRWARAQGGRRIHLVPVPDTEGERTFLLHAKPLCGRKRELFQYPWGDQPECATCEERAREIAQAVAS
jgi:hypothetical protein